MGRQKYYLVYSDISGFSLQHFGYTDSTCQAQSHNPLPTAETKSEYHIPLAVTGLQITKNAERTGKLGLNQQAFSYEADTVQSNLKSKNKTYHLELDTREPSELLQ